MYKYYSSGKTDDTNRTALLEDSHDNRGRRVKNEPHCTPVNISGQIIKEEENNLTRYTNVKFRVKKIVTIALRNRID